MAAKPNFPYGYQGQQPKFGEFGLSTVSHAQPEIVVNDNQLEIQIMSSQAMKVTHQLFDATNDQDHSDLVFTQTQGNIITFVATIPHPGWFKLQLFALPATDDSKSLPGVYNYVINCTNCPRPVCAFPKQYAQWKEGCYLTEPLVINNNGPLNLNFKVAIPNARAVAVVSEGDWTHLDKKGNDVYEGQVNLEKHRGKGAKVTLNANYAGQEETRYSTLLEYNL